MSNGVRVNVAAPKMPAMKKVQSVRQDAFQTAKELFNGIIRLRKFHITFDFLHYLLGAIVGD
jgi:hypothetical protein